MSEEQMRSYIIDKDSYDKNILVEAGAGAGKTRLIIQRVIGQIGAGIPVEKIVLITFTNAAANELYERIQAGLTENIAKCSGEEKKLFLDFCNAYGELMGESGLDFTAHEDKHYTQLLFEYAVRTAF